MALTTRPADEIKITVIEYLIGRYPGIIIGNEVMYGTSRKVADLLVLYQGETYAIEIKSDKDNLRRLPEQLKEYSLIFDHTIVFTHSKYKKEVLSLVLPRVSVYEVLNGNINKVKNSNSANSTIKREMVYSISSVFLRRFLSTAKKIDSDMIRTRIIRTYNKRGVHNIFYQFLEQKLANGFKLFLHERYERNSVDDLSLLSARLNI
ncbi:sce7726 family protein [Prevotella sp. OH937_COT-195]|uniref:sce7726 family protein n=1 Tax=Prevotella sp. OH937_COT-195 TaxID=2491051 RepID=UPI0011CF1121|nr:sce7726 family protein [Prevotella sp. OH937_COT-195]